MSTTPSCENETGATLGQRVTTKHMKSALEPHLGSDKKVLDFGCGDGGVTLSFSRHVGEIVGVDPFGEAIEKFNKKMEPDATCAYAAPNTRAVQVDLVAQPLSEQAEKFFQENEGSFDVVLSSLAFHHIEHVDHTLKGLYRLVKKDGLVCFCDIVKQENSTFYHPTGPNIPHVYHLQGFTVEQMTQWLQDSGFVDIHFELFTIEDMGVSHLHTEAFPLFMVMAKKL